MAARVQQPSGHAVRTQQQDAREQEDLTVDTALAVQQQDHGHMQPSLRPATVTITAPAEVASHNQHASPRSLMAGMSVHSPGSHSPKGATTPITSTQATPLGCSAGSPVPEAACLPSTDSVMQEGIFISLQSYCLAMVGLYIQDYVQVLGPQLSLLPPDSKATLLAISRRRNTLNDDVLLTLLDSSWRFLDVSGAGLDLSTEAFLSGLQLLPRLQALDISGCVHLSSPKVLSAIATRCPHVKLLRCGGGVACNTAMELSLPPLLPGLIQPAVLADSWEEAFAGELLEEEDAPIAAHTPAPVRQQPVNEPSIPSAGIILSPIVSSDNASPSSQAQTRSNGPQAATAPTAPVQQRMQKLRQVIWPAAPDTLIQQAAQQCPALAFNPSSQCSQFSVLQVKPGSLWHGPTGAKRDMPPSPFCDPAMPMDELWCDQLPQSTWQGVAEAHLTPFTQEQQALVSAETAAAESAVHCACLLQLATQARQQQQPAVASHSSQSYDSRSVMRSCEGAVGHTSVTQAKLPNPQHPQPGDGSADEEEEDEEPLLPIAERFRQAYIDRAARLKQKAVKQAAAASLRQLKSMSPAMAAVSRWLDDY